MSVDASDEFIGPYQSVEDLGVGGYSRVKLALDPNKKKYVAIKILLSEPAKDENKQPLVPTQWTISDSKVKQCRREIGLMREIQHKNVVQLLDFIEDAKFPQSDPASGETVNTPCLCVVLEYCSRGELFDFLMYTGRLGERATRTYFFQFLDGLQAMHKSGYAHRDLKPENLLLSDDFTLKIADFGFATQFKDRGRKIKMATTCGTKGYLAPELLAGKKYSHKVDLFAVGIIMFTTFAGFPPFQHAGAGDWWWDKMNKAWTYWNEAPQAANEVEREERFKKGNEKMKLFWAAHERSLPFEDKFKDLMQNLLNPFPAQRFDIEDCLKHPWMKGKTFSKKNLIRYMKQYSATVRAQRAIKIDKQLKDQNMEAQRTNAGKYREGLSHSTPQHLQKQADDYTEAVLQIEEIPAIVGKANFKFETEKSMLDILTSIDLAARAHGARVDLNIAKCEVKVLASIARPKLQGEDIQIAVKIYKAELATFDNASIDGTFDIEGEFLELEEKESNDSNDSNEDEKNDNVNNVNNENNDSKKQRWAIFFYRLLGSADGYQQMMEKIFYAPLVSSLMDNKQFLPTNNDIYNKIAQMPESARAFTDTFKPLKDDADIPQMAGLDADLPMPEI